jgi:hypothetical protein
MSYITLLVLSGITPPDHADATFQLPDAPSIQSTWLTVDAPARELWATEPPITAAAAANNNLAFNFLPMVKTPI